MKLLVEIQNNRNFKAVQIGGPSGGCIPTDLLDTPVDYDSLLELGRNDGFWWNSSYG